VRRTWITPRNRGNGHWHREGQIGLSQLSLSLFCGIDCAQNLKVHRKSRHKRSPHRIIRNPVRPFPQLTVRGPERALSLGLHIRGAEYAMAHKVVTMRKIRSLSPAIIQNVKRLARKGYG